MMFNNNDKWLLNRYKNDMFSELRGNDLLDLISKIEDITLNYRDSLDLPRDITFGVELEYENLDKEIVDNYVKENLKDWKSKTDTSVEKGGEIASCMLYDTKTDWNNLKKACEFLKKKSIIYSDTTGGHVNICEYALKKDVDAWQIFFKTYAIYENILFRFGYNDRIKERFKIKDFAIPISKKLYETLPIFSDNDWNYSLVDKFFRIKYESLSLRKVELTDNDKNRYGNTIEFRFPNGTFEEVIWQNNINAFVKMILSSKNKSIDEEFLDYKLEKEEIAFKYDSCSYNEVDLRNALEFVDLIFDNNLDKVYFLRQYLKDFAPSFPTVADKNVKVKRFVR